MQSRGPLPRLCFSLVAFAILLITACGTDSSGVGNKYVTKDGLEPDIWASIWLIKRRVDPQAEIILRPVGAPPGDGIAFGLPDAKYKRSHGTSVYESLRQGFHQTDPALEELGRIIHDIEISPWGDKTSKHSAVVEQSFRHLQDQFTSRSVPVDCYGRFFDSVYALLQLAEAKPDWDSLYGIAESDPACRNNSNTLARREDSPFVRRLEAGTVLDYIAANKKVIFVDVRETAEYEEFHIPGAINIQLRDVSTSLIPQLEGADLIIPYCIKDFRGFEMARSLVELGLPNVGIMNPYGIAGWRQAGLPVAGKAYLPEADALEKLTACAESGTCLTILP